MKSGDIEEKSPHHWRRQSESLDDFKTKTQPYSREDDTYYRRAPSDINLNPELLHQALLPPSRFSSDSSSNGTIINLSSVANNKPHFPPGLNRTVASSSRRRITSRFEDSDAALTSAQANEGNGKFSSANYTSGKGKKKSGNKKDFSSKLQISAAVLLWYLLGVISISTTKIILTDYSVAGMTPLILTMQQFVIGIIFLRGWIYVRNGELPYPIPMRKIRFSQQNRNNAESVGYDKLIASSTFFTMGFLLTNLSFSGADASFVETVKASEPISSACLAFLWGIEKMGLNEVCSLVMICIGVVISTLGNSHGTAIEKGAVTLVQSICSSGIVIGANLSFSFRGLYQKLFRASPNGGSQLIDDLNLQFRIHQVGIIAMIIPFIVFDLSSLLRVLFDFSPLISGRQFRRFFVISLINGFAFTHYK